MVSVLHLLAVFVLSIIELWIGIPVGFAFGLPPLVIGLVASVGATIGAIFVYLLVRKFIAWAIKKLDMDIRGISSVVGYSASGRNTGSSVWE